MKNQRGFTLIELLLVLAIIGIISAIAIPALLGQRESARQKATESAAGAIKAEIAVYAEMVRKSGTPPVAADVVTAVLGMPQYKFPAAKNAYTPNLAPYTTAVAGTDGDVGVVAATVTGADTKVYDVVNVSFKHKGSSIVPIMQVSLDQ